MNKVALYYFEPEEYSDYYYELEPKKERIFVLKVKNEKKNKNRIYLFRIKSDSFDKLLFVNNDYKFLSKLNDEVFGNETNPIKFDNTNEILNANNVNNLHNISLSKRNSTNSNVDMFQSYNKISDSNNLGKDEKSPNVSSDYSRHDNLSLSRGHF